MAKKKRKTSDERRATKKKPARRPSNRQSSIVNRKSPRTALSEAAAQRLGFEHTDLAAADAVAGLKRNLAKLLGSPRHPRLKAAFQRGQFLRNLRGLAGVVATVSEAAGKLGLANGEALREILDTDAEAADIWGQTRLDTILDARAALLAAAKDGNTTAIRTVENYLREEKQASGGGADLDHLTQKDICELLAVTRVTLADWQKGHRMPRNADRSYNLSAVIGWYADFLKSKASGPAPPADTLRDMKAEKMRLEVRRQKGELLDRVEVVGGFVARWQMLVGAFTYKRRELAMMLHGQTADGIEQILGRFFEDRQAELLEVPEFLRLPATAEKKLAECYELLTTNGHE